VDPGEVGLRGERRGEERRGEERRGEELERSWRLWRGGSGGGGGCRLCGGVVCEETDEAGER
jgi:hypothetical protein